ncbi:hypothetical protein ACIGGF_15815 [Rhodococcus sp. NPDC078407]|uniref:hypothetical protein n=1 Tax=unclassified Rhodococcus (in: high G+C Gram-positive bacteria) TaxID=192944 RepID=UPI001595A4E6|nr:MULTISPECIES: hypothetical protein [unclassified Rhodococcus (in: high G+C Gram-positive bacteria)]MDI9896460.1 hypothetical protein [Rhodococcus sp. IEGM 1381]MDI9928686.1 hypothetical protein [Rhodococcus sp. IEGM 1341]
MSALTNDRLDLRRVKKTPEQIQRLHAKARKELGTEAPVAASRVSKVREAGKPGKRS